MKTFTFVAFVVTATLFGHAHASVSIVPLSPAIGNLGLPWAINNHGQIAGMSYSGHPNNFRVATTWVNGDAIPLFDSSLQSNALAINDSGQITGQFGVVLGGGSAFIATDGVITLLEPWGSGHAINQSGVVAGNSGDIASMWQPNGRPMLLGTLSGKYSYASCINDDGEIVGHSSNPMRIEAFRWSDGVMKPLGTLGYGHSEANSINNAGIIVGKLQNDSGHTEGFIHDGFAMQGIGTFGYQSSTLWAINNNNQAIGTVWNPGGMRSMLYQNGQVTLLADLLPENSGWSNLDAFDINDCFQIVGYGVFQGSVYGFVMTIHEGDVDGDTLVNADDLLAVINAWGPCLDSCTADVWPLGGNSVVNVDDLLEVINHWGD